MEPSHTETPTPAIEKPRVEVPPPEKLPTEAPERAQLFVIPDMAAVTTASWLKFALAAFVELLIASAFVAFVLIRPKPLQQAAPSPKPMPKLIGRGLSRGHALSSLSPTRRVYEYVVDRLEEREGTMVPFSDIYLDYEAWCQHHRTSALTPYDFAERMKVIFKGSNVFTRERNNIVQLVNVCVAGSG